MVGIILAAGKGTRMKSKLPKVLHTICGKPMGRFVIDACIESGMERCVVVIGHGAEQVRDGLGEDVSYVIQEQQLGTGDACRQALPALGPDVEDVMVLPGDAPLIQAETLAALIREHEATGAAATVLTAVLPDAGSYGRIIRAGDNSILGIVEAKDATPEQRAVREINTGIYCFRLHLLQEALSRITPANAQGEYYLTDVIALLVQAGEKVCPVVSEETDVILGVNDRADLAHLTAIIRARVNRGLMLAGVTMTDPASTYVDTDVRVGPDTVIHPMTVLERGTVIGEGCTIGPSTRLVNSRIGDECVILASNIVDTEMGHGCKVGPYSNLRPGTRLGNKVKIGDFVETKNALIHDSVSLSHLSYIGDAEVGERTNVGAGTITCNYDGYKKSRTTIGKNVFLGSNTIMVAPVEIGDGSLTAAGSIITEDVPADALAVARARQVVKEDWARERREQMEKERE